MFRKIIVFVALVIGTVGLVGCGPNIHSSKETYFDGAVIVEYSQSSSNDYLTLRFYEKGTYEISFSFNPNMQGQGRGKPPQDFTKTIEVTPREIVIKQRFLPHYLRVTITRDGKSELHDFS